jgi:hypothetical protein
VPHEIDWDAERARAGQATQRTLGRTRIDAGYNVRPAKGGHVAAFRPGLSRPVIIQSRMYRSAALRIVSQLEEGVRDG